MSPNSHLYQASAGTTEEMRRALRIFLAGLRPPDALCFPGGDFSAWSTVVFDKVIAPHCIDAWQLAVTGDAAALARADLALPLPASSATAGLRLLRQRAGALYIPVTRRFTAFAAEGRAAGHFSTAMALQSVDFSLGLLPLLQCLLFCEWQAGQAGEALRDLDTFFLKAGHEFRRLPSLLPHHDTHPAIPAARAIHLRR